MNAEDVSAIEKKLDTMIELLQQILALELFKSAATQDEIGRRLRLRKATVNKMLKGLRKEKVLYAKKP